MVSQDLEAVIHAEGEHVAVVGRHRVVIALLVINMFIYSNIL